MNTLVPDVAPRELRRRAMMRLAEVVGGEAMTYQLYGVDGVTYYGSPIGTGDLHEMAIKSDGAPVMGGSVSLERQDGWSVASPLDVNTHSFARFGDDRDMEDITATEAWRTFYVPQEISDHLRALFYLEGELIAYLAGIRHGGDRFTRDEQQIADRLVPQLYDDLQLAWSMERAEVGDRTLHLVLDERRHVVYAGEAAAAWLTPRRRELLRAMRSEPRARLIDGVHVSEMRLEARPGGLVYACLSAARTPRVSRGAHLSKSQLQIAKLASKGLTNHEIARVTGLSASTVKYHLGRIYEAIGARGRQELTAVSG